MLLEQQTLTIEDLTRRGQELKRQVEESAQLKDQLDEYRHIAEKLQKAENVIEKFKKKMEDSADLKRQVKGLEDQNHSLMERNQQIENEYRKVLAFKTLMDSYKDQVAMLETKNNELIREKNKREYDLQQMTKKIDMMEMDRARDSDRILTLEDHLQEAQLGVSRSTLQTESMDVDEEEDEDHNLDGSLEESLKETNVTELKRSKRRLERELRTLQEKSDIGSKSDKAMVLQHLLEDANRLKAQFERNYLEVSQERDILQSDMARVREGISDALLDDSDYTMSLRLHIIDLEKESKQLRADVSRLEDRVNDNGYHAPAHRPSFALAGIDQLEGGADIDAFKAQYKEMTTKQALLEEQTKKQLQDINKLLFEKDTLQRQHMDQKDQLLEKERLYSEMKASLAVFEAKDDEPVKKMVAQLQQQLVQKQEQFSETQAKLKRAREVRHPVVKACLIFFFYRSLSGKTKW
ncbi:hypothetical protein DM01DRAFT_1024989 [Hesseltinella vesiculosa]|uniref:Hook C-terminal domain-containing protein n=1 Tax=Hesseltinella vesiculosa TaxID=101127 RepID=A0A1X2GK63_9FUNG|nr:hypothetical protein DM01DRAFT_1024989 [Hesseltinella vesiculosa]